MVTSSHFALLALAIVSGTSELQAKMDPDLARVISEGIRSGWDSIRTIHLEYEETSKANLGQPEGQGSTATVRSSFWKDGSKFRTKTSITTDDGRGDSEEDSYSDGAEAKTLTRPTTKNSVRTRGGIWETATFKDQTPFGAPLSYMLLAVVPDGAGTKLADWLEKSKIVEIKSVRDLEGNLQYEVHALPTARGILASLRVRVLPKQNFPVQEATIVGAGTSGQEHFVMDAFQDHSGILFPTKLTHTARGSPTGSDDHSKTSTIISQISFSTVEINKPIDPAVFDFEFPNGIAVQDRRTMTAYRWPPGSSREIPLFLPPSVAGDRGWRFLGIPVVALLVSLPLLLAVAVVVWRIRARRAVKSVRLDR